MPTLENGTIIVTLEDVRTAFPAFADETAYPDEMLTGCLEMAQCFISNKLSGCGDVSFDCRALMIELMTCHLAYLLQTAAASGSSGAAADSASGMVVSASIGDVHVTTAVPQNQNQLQWYLNQTPYGQQLYTLLSIKVSPVYFGGSRQRIFNKWR